MEPWDLVGRICSDASSRHFVYAFTAMLPSPTAGNAPQSQPLNQTRKATWPGMERRILEGVNSEIEKAETFNRASKPRNVAHDLVSPGESRGMADRRCVG